MANTNKKVSKCGCGNNKARRYLVCSKCFGSMTEEQKEVRRAVSRTQKEGTLRRWAA